MKAIIIEDKDARALLDQLALDKCEGSNTLMIRVDKGEHKGEWVQMDERGLQFVIDGLHRKFHYIVTRWLQEQGADVLRH